MNDLSTFAVRIPYGDGSTTDLIVQARSQKEADAFLQELRDYSRRYDAAYKAWRRPHWRASLDFETRDEHDHWVSTVWDPALDEFIDAFRKADELGSVTLDNYLTATIELINCVVIAP